MKKGFTFTATGDHLPYDVTISLPEDASMEELLHAFENYLRASGFYIDMDDFVTVEEGKQFDVEVQDMYNKELTGKTFGTKDINKILDEVDKTLSKYTKKSNVVTFTKKGEEEDDDQ